MNYQGITIVVSEPRLLEHTSSHYKLGVYRVSIVLGEGCIHMHVYVMNLCYYVSACLI